MAKVCVRARLARVDRRGVYVAVIALKVVEQLAAGG